VLTIGSIDSSVIEKEIMFMKYIQNGDQQTRFLTYQAPETGIGVALKLAIEKGFKSVDVDNWKGILITIGTCEAFVNIV